ncbi:MAG TPA: hypothetical protein VF525_06270 [Pyrinomonadaceae bacterium]|jgi:hypothetical protein
MKTQVDDTSMAEHEFDARITYPCYKSFDEFIDVARLKSLDGYITERIIAHLKAQTDDYFLNQHRLNAATPQRPGVREIWLTRTRPGVPYNYLDLDKPELWTRTSAAQEFSALMEFIETLPFKATGRMLIIYDDAARSVPAHRDHLSIELCHEFIWLRTNLNKPFYLFNQRTNERLYVSSYSAWFDTVNQFHGSDAQAGLSFSIRVDGHFTDEFRQQIPTPAFNLASTPALWASVSS